MKVRLARPAWMISRPSCWRARCRSRRRDRASGRPTAPRSCGADRYVEPGAVAHALEQVVEEDRMRLAGVRAPEQDHIGLLDLCVGRRAAARSEHRRQTDDARRVSGSVTGVDVVRAHHLTGELPRQEVHLVRRLGAGEDPERGRGVGLAGAGEAGCGPVEGLVPGGGAQDAVLADERGRQPSLVFRIVAPPSAL